MLLPDKLINNHFIKELQEWPVEAAGIEYGTGLVVKTKLSPGHCLKELFQCPVATHHHYETISQVRHHGFTLVHRRDDTQVTDTLVGHSLGHQTLGYDSDYLPAGR